MTRGGARNRSGPTADPKSGRSERRDYSLEALPAAGFTGRAPAYPLARDELTITVKGESVVLEAESRAFRKRELELWRELWRTPQACAWSMPENHWRWRIIANYCRLSVRCESGTAPASLLAQLHRFADQIGMTTAGLAEMGWAIANSPAAASPAPGAAPASAASPAKPAGGARDRLKVVPRGA